MKKIMVAVMTFVMAVIFMACKESIPKIEMVEIPGMNIKMLKIEVTQELYKSVMGENPSDCFGRDRPVECVSWYDAVYFCNRLSEMKGKRPVYAVDGETDVTKWGYTPHKSEDIGGEITQNLHPSGFRLPTIEEWQYAAKGGEDYRYAGSDELDAVGWYDENSNDKTHAVARKKPNGYGLYDMSGNVWEWCWDFHSGDYGHYVCGGSCYSDVDACEVDSKGCNSPHFRSRYIGFRLVCPSK